MKKIHFIILFIIVVTVSCTKYRDVPGKSAVFIAPADGAIAFGSLRINEFICSGSDSKAVTYLGSNAKWFELYNPTNTDIILTSGQWFITDELTTKTKFAIPQNTLSAQWKVPAKGYLVIMCVKAGSTTPADGRINASFSLNGSLGDIGIFYQKTPSSPILAIDTISYSFNALSGVSYGRKPDGQDPGALQLNSVTPEATNN